MTKYSSQEVRMQLDLMYQINANALDEKTLNKAIYLNILKVHEMIKVV